MSAGQWLNWMRGRKREAPQLSPLQRSLGEAGATAAQLTEAAGQKVLLRTRLVSALVVDGAMTEREGVSVLGEHVGMGGVCLDESVIDLEVPALPMRLCAEELVLPLIGERGGAATVAFADRPDEGLVQEIEALMGCAIVPRIALHSVLRKTVSAVTSLRREVPDARLLLGDDVRETEGTRLQARVAHVASSRPTWTAPEERGGATGETVSVVVAMTSDSDREGVEALCNAAGLQATCVGSAGEAMRQIASDAPALVVVSRLLPGLSGVEMARYLMAGRRYGACAVWVVGPQDMGCAPGFSESARLRFSPIPSPGTPTGGELVQWLSAAMGSAQGHENTKALSLKAQAQAQCLRGQAALLEEDREKGRSAFNEAVQLDPFIFEAQVALAHVGGEQPPLVDRRLRMAEHLGVLAPRDVRLWAMAVEQLGDWERAALLWGRAASCWPDPEQAARLRAHAVDLRGGRVEVPEVDG